MIKNNSIAYGSISKILHWLIGLSIIALLSVGLFMTLLPAGDQKWFFYGMHKAFGMIVLFLVVFRVIWRVINVVPELPAAMPVWQKRLSNISHYGLYALMITFPFTGYLMSVFGGRNIDMFGLFAFPAFTEGKTEFAGFAHYVHVNLPYFFIGLILLHIVAALYHHFIVKDNVLRRML